MNQNVYDATVQPGATLFDVDEGKYLQGEKAEYVPDSPCGLLRKVCTADSDAERNCKLRQL